MPLKTCDLSCVYCQLGRTRCPTARRRAFFPAGEIFAEVATALVRREPDAIDWITFVGSGETTLYSRLGSLIRRVKSLTEVPVAVITNGSLLHLPKVREELMAADAVLPSLDAGTEMMYRRVNRPSRGLTLADHVDGMIEFRRAYGGSFWVEIMLVGGINDSSSALNDIAALVERVEPDEIHLSTPTRPPTEPWVEIPSRDNLERAVSILGRVAKVLPPTDMDAVTSIDGELVDAIVSIIARHPLKESEVKQLLTRWLQGRLEDALDALPESGRIQVVERYGERFWCAAGLAFPKSSPNERPLAGSEQFRVGDKNHGGFRGQSTWPGTRSILRGCELH